MKCKTKKFLSALLAAVMFAGLAMSSAGASADTSNMDGLVQESTPMHDNLILIHSVDGQWETSFTASEACTGWKDSDTLKIKDSFLMSGSIDDNGVVTLRAPLDCYGPGYTIWVQIENITQGNWRQIPVNFTNRDIPTFRSQEDYAFVLDYIGQPLARSADVYIDSSLDSIPYLSDDTIKTFEDSMKARMEAMGEYFENPVAEPAVESLN